MTVLLSLVHSSRSGAHLLVAREKPALGFLDGTACQKPLLPVPGPPVAQSNPRNRKRVQENARRDAVPSHASRPPPLSCQHPAAPFSFAVCRLDAQVCWCGTCPARLPSPSATNQTRIDPPAYLSRSSWALRSAFFVHERSQISIAGRSPCAACQLPKGCPSCPRMLGSPQHSPAGTPASTQPCCPAGTLPPSAARTRA